MKSSEVDIRVQNGWMFLFLQILLVIGIVWLFYHAISHRLVLYIITAAICVPFWFLFWNGFFMLQPNQAAVLILFGKYVGTVKQTGFHWTNPLNAKIKVSLRARNLEGEKLKVNDLMGNPIEIAAVVVWRVSDTAQATFDVDDYRKYMAVQSDAAMRHLASIYPYDSGDDEVLSLRRSRDEISEELTKELQERMEKAGIHIDEARLSHLAYAPEIAGAMLQRQQAEAVVAARTRIVDGAVGMVELALEKLEEKQTVVLDEERKAAMVSNLLVVLCSDRGAQPVMNAGTLYH